MKKLCFIFSLLFLMVLTSVTVFAETAGHGSGHSAGAEDHGIPWYSVAIQAVNLGILLVLIFFFVRKGIVAAFAKRQADYQEQSQKTAQLLAQAENELKDIKTKLTTLESTELSSLEKAQQEAEVLKNKMIAETEQQAKKMKDDVALIVTAEVYKAKNEIRSAIIDASFEQAREAVKAQATAITQKSEKGFVADLGQVRT